MIKHLDKLHHVVYSFALATAGAFLFGESVGILVAALLGITKEIWDGMSPRNRFDWRDLVANCAGLLAAWVVMKG